MHHLFGYKTYLIAVILCHLASCGGGGSSNSAVVKTGYFIDSAVSGLEYTSGNTSGISGVDGSFQYEEGKPVTFKIGSMTLGSVIVRNERIFPVDLVSGATDESHPNATLIAQILQTLDSDGDASNGINITESTRKSFTHAVEVSATDPNQTITSISQLLVAATANRTTGPASVLISEADAKNHMKSNLLKEYVGNWTGDYGGNEVGICDITIALSADETDASVTGFCAVKLTPEDTGPEPMVQTVLKTINSATLKSSGEFSGSLDDLAEFKGRFNRNGTMSGTWTKSIYGGAWSMTKQ